MSQKKYALDMLEETGMMNAKPANSPLETATKLQPNEGELLEDASMYRRLVGKLIY